MKTMKMGFAAIAALLLNGCDKPAAPAPANQDDITFDQSCGDGRGVDLVEEANNLLSVVLIDDGVVGVVDVSGMKAATPVGSLTLRLDMEEGAFAAAAKAFCSKPTSADSAVNVAAAVAKGMAGKGYDVTVGAPTMTITR